MSIPRCPECAGESHTIKSNTNDGVEEKHGQILHAFDCPSKEKTKMKTPNVVMLVVLSAAAVSGCAVPKRAVSWSGGEPIIVYRSQANEVMGPVPEHELGFREDGVVVWRDKK